MTQQKIAPWVYAALVVLTAFALGYLVGTGNAQPEIVVTAVYSDEQGIVQPEEEQNVDTVFPVDLNTADQQTLESLPGIGPELAERIISYRKTIGKFVSTEQIMDVEGIGQKRYEALQDLIIVEVAHENTGS